MRTKPFCLGIAFAISLALISDASAQQTRLFFTSMSPAGSPNSKFFNDWARKIEADSKGTLAIEVKDGVSTLGTMQNIIERVDSDVAQIGWTIHQFYRGKFPLSEVAGLPFIADESELSSAAMWRLWKTGLLDAEYKNIVPLFFGRSGNTHLHLRKAPPSIDNLKGLKVRVGGTADIVMANALGMSPQSTRSQDIYVALQRGTIDGALISFAGFSPYSLHEVTSYHLLAPLGSSTTLHFMSRKKFDSLPAAAREAIEANSGEVGSRSWGKFLDDLIVDVRDNLNKSKDHTMVTPTAAQMQDLAQRVGKPVIDKWVEENPEGAKVLEAYKKIYAEVKAGK
jgi:TRAP-type C4-dicarboxylate transport system substrate-binding protein